MSQIYSVLLLQAFKAINEGRMGYVPTIKVTRHFFRVKILNVILIVLFSYKSLYNISLSPLLYFHFYVENLTEVYTSIKLES